jgi:general secretion pathway protein A
MEKYNDLRSYYHFTAIPFTPEIATGKRWKSQTQEEILRAIKATIENRMSACIISPSGTGKTLLTRTLVEEELPAARFRTGYIPLTGLGKREFYRQIALVLGCTPKGMLSSLISSIQERCLSLLEQESLRPVLIIDEAHDMSPHVMAILRVLTNFAMDSRLVLSLLLVGQPPLKTLLRRDELEGVACRMAHFDTLRLLTQKECFEYIRHRLSICDGKSDLFDPTALDAIYECTQGNFRAIDRLCLKSLQLAAAQAAPIVEPAIVAQARQRLLS